MATRTLPKVMRKIVATKISQNFRDATRIQEVPLPTCKAGDILIKNRYVGINASDINITAGRYDPSVKVPFDCGMECIGEVVEAGTESPYKTGQTVMYFGSGAFTEYKLVKAKHAMPTPSISPEYLTLMVSGLTAAIGLDKVGHMKSSDTVLVTAAAGGTGQIAVQWAKSAGCHVLGTCSTPEKAQLLKSIGCDRPINYKEEKLVDVLKSEYPNGIDVIYESVGGEMFDTCVNSLATKGRLIVIGYISGYESSTGFQPSRTSALPQKLLRKSATVSGFFVPHYEYCQAEYFQKLLKLYTDGKLKLIVDRGETAVTGPFKGLESVVDAIEYMYTGKNKGKIVVEVNQSNSSKL